MTRPWIVLPAIAAVMRMLHLNVPGEEIVIAKSGKPKARLVPLAPKQRRPLRGYGAGKGKVWIADDFDAPLPPEILRYFTGESE